MYGQEVIKPYGEGEKAKQVEEMFDNIAPSYDKLNHRLSWNIDKGAARHRHGNRRLRHLGRRDATPAETCGS